MITNSKAMIRLDHHVSAGNLYGDVHALPDAGVCVHHLVLRQEQALFVPPREIPGPNAHSVDYQDHRTVTVTVIMVTLITVTVAINLRMSYLSFSPLLR